jgi:hypothetical protein
MLADVPPAGRDGFKPCARCEILSGLRSGMKLKFGRPASGFPTALVPEPTLGGATRLYK